MHRQGLALVLKERSLTSAGLRMTRASDSSLARLHRGVRRAQQRLAAPMSVGYLRRLLVRGWGGALTMALSCLDC